MADDSARSTCGAIKLTNATLSIPTNIHMTYSTHLHSIVRSYKTHDAYKPALPITKNEYTIVHYIYHGYIPQAHTLRSNISQHEKAYYYEEVYLC